MASGTQLPAHVVTSFDKALAKYPAYYDEVFDEVAARIRKSRSASKLDIAALSFWKRSAQGEWLTPFLEIPEAKVRRVAAAALADGLSIKGRARHLWHLDGFKKGNFAIGSALLAASNPNEFPVTDRHAQRADKSLFKGCECALTWYDVYVRAVLGLRDALTTSSNRTWTAREIDQALSRLDKDGNKLRGTFQGTRVLHQSRRGKRIPTRFVSIHCGG